MAYNKSVKSNEFKEETTSDFYKLKSDAVNDLITANEENSPAVSPEELKKYRKQSKLHLSDTLKAVLIKMWFAGAVCFFIFWGLGTYIRAELDMLFVFAVVLGIVNDLLVNNIFRFYEKTPGANDRYMMFPKKSFLNFFMNIFYSGIVLAAVYMLYNVLNTVIISISGAPKDGVPVGVEPILFGVLYMAVDMLFIKMKLTFKKIVDDAKKSVK